MSQVSTALKPPRIERGGWLDALRFIVAGLIILHHFELSAPIPLKEFHPVFEHAGFLLTNFFLMDSGYVLARVYGEQVVAGRMKAGDFVRKRFLRVIPAHLIMVGGLAALVFTAGLFGVAPRHPEWFDWRELPAQAALVQAYGVPGGLGWNAPTWSISALLGCYLAFPLLIRLTSRGSAWGVLAGGVAFYGVALLLTTTLLGYPVWQMPMEHGFVRALPLFLFGMVLARFSQDVYINPRVAGWMMAGAALTLAVLQAYGKNAAPSLVCIAVIIAAAGAIPVRRRSALVEKAALVSFSMFITNEVVRIVWFGAVNVLEAKFGWPEPVQWALWALGVAAAFAFAFAFHHVIDMPLQRWLNRKPAPRGQAIGQTPGVTPGIA